LNSALVINVLLILV